VSVLNGVVLVSSIRQARGDGVGVLDAVVRGCTLRFRPIVVSGIVAVIGFIPAALSHGIGSEIQRPLARVVVGGLIFVLDPHAARAAGRLRAQSPRGPSTGRPHRPGAQPAEGVGDPAVSRDEPALGPDDMERESDGWIPGIYRCPACSLRALVEEYGGSPRCPRQGCPWIGIDSSDPHPIILPSRGCHLAGQKSPVLSLPAAPRDGRLANSRT